jgi:hypothetical protein
MFPPTLTAFQRKGRCAYWHIASGCLFVVRGGLFQTRHSTQIDLSAVSIGLYRIDICSNCRSPHHSGNKHNRKCG